MFRFCRLPQHPELPSAPRALRSKTTVPGMLRHAAPAEHRYRTTSITRELAEAWRREVPLEVQVLTARAHSFTSGASLLVRLEKEHRKRRRAPDSNEELRREGTPDGWRSAESKAVLFRYLARRHVPHADFELLVSHQNRQEDILLC